jgi:hypothetical protein
MDAPESSPPRVGRLAIAAGQAFPLEVCQSRAGFYLGTRDQDSAPFTRESAEYWARLGAAEEAWRRGAWTQRLAP